MSKVAAIPKLIFHCDSNVNLSVRLLKLKKTNPEEHKWVSMLSAPIQLNQPIFVHTQAISATINCSESM